MESDSSKDSTTSTLRVKSEAPSCSNSLVGTWNNVYTAQLPAAGVQDHLHPQHYLLRLLCEELDMLHAIRERKVVAPHFSIDQSTRPMTRLLTGSKRLNKS